jgi:hypothetical protein
MELEKTMLVINTISKYYDFAITGFSDLMFLDCDGWKASSSLAMQPDCRTYYNNGTLTPVNRYSHNREYQGNYSKIFEEFVKEVNNQDDYNKDGNIKAIPVVAYHDFRGSGFADVSGGGGDDASTDAKLFEAEMRYLYENGFRIITMADLGYDERINSIYIK